MYREFRFDYAPILIGASKKYIIELPIDSKPVIYKTMTTNMGSWLGEVDIIINADDGNTYVSAKTARGSLYGRVIGPVKKKHPCWVMEHLNVDGRMEYLVASEKLLDGNVNFINYGIPNEKYIRIDIYTGEYRIINNG